MSIEPDECATCLVRYLALLDKGIFVEVCAVQPIRFAPRSCRNSCSHTEERKEKTTYSLPFNVVLYLLFNTLT